MSCGIPDLSGDEFIITGGSKEDTSGITEVSVYNKDGWQSNLASLNQGRYGHGCTSFINDGKLVWVKNNGYNYEKIFQVPASRWRK